MRPIAAVERHPFRGIAGRLRHGLLAGAMCVAGTAAWAGPGISYTAVDLSDTGTGDLWRYDYTVSGPLAGFGGVQLMFSASLYSDLLSSSTDGDNFLTDTQPDAGFGVDGFVTLQRLSDLMAAATTTLSVEFVWLGTGAPGSQTFQVFDDSGNFSNDMRTTAAASSPVPEPTGLVLAALLALAVTSRRQRHGA